jgi:L-glyceraldehyde 3-phosphate reductase
MSLSKPPALLGGGDRTIIPGLVCGCDCGGGAAIGELTVRSTRRRAGAMIRAVTYFAADDRYDRMPYRRTGRWGLKLPAISLGLWHNFGDDARLETQRAILRRAFDLGVTHFDLANQYGPPTGSAETNFGRLLREDFAPYRDELVISSKAGFVMNSGPYGAGSSRKHLLQGLDQSLLRMGLDHVDIFYSHRFDAETPLDETMSALDAAVRQGKALYVGISSYSASRSAAAVTILRELGTPLLIHQPNYSMFNRSIETDLLAVLDEHGVGCIAFSPLAQGMLTNKYLSGVPGDARAAKGGSLSTRMLVPENMERIRGLDAIAGARGQSLAQMAIAWVLRDPRVTSALIGARTVEQLEDSLAALGRPDFSDEELRGIDSYAGEAGVDLWKRSSEVQALA